MTTTLAQIESHVADERAARKRGGRPSLPVEERRVRRVTVPFSAEEFQHILKMSGAARVASATFIRAAALRVKINRTVVPDEYLAAWVALSRTAGNINQLTFRVNIAMATGNAIDRKDIAELHGNALPQIHREIQDLRRILLKVEDDQ